MTVVSGCQHHATDRATSSRKPASPIVRPRPILAGVHVGSGSCSSGVTAETDCFAISAGPFSTHNRSRSAEQDPKVGPEGPPPGISQIEAHHLIEGRATAARHLPEAGNPRLGFQDSAAMPRRVMLKLVRKGRSRANQ